MMNIVTAAPTTIVQMTMLLMPMLVMLVVAVMSPNQLLLSFMQEAKAVAEVQSEL